MGSADSDNHLHRETLRNLKEREELTKQFGKHLSSSAETIRPVKVMSREKTESSVASKLKKTGVALIALPDPVTGVVGVPALAAGLALEKLAKRDLTLPEVARELAKTVKELERARRAGFR